MGIVIRAEDVVASGLKNIPFKIALENADLDSVTITLRGLPDQAGVRGGTLDKDHNWSVPATQLGGAKLDLDAFPAGSVQVAVVAEGNDNAGVASRDASKFTLGIVPDGFTRATTKQKIILSVLMILGTIGIFICWRLLYKNAENILASDNSVSWVAADNVQLRAGPATFWYDTAKKELHVRGPVDLVAKQVLLNLAHVRNPTLSGALDAEKTHSGSTEDIDPGLAGFYRAVDELSFKSNDRMARYFLYLLAIGGLSGVLGAQIRAFANLVYISTTADKLDVVRWWTWYALRPVTGFLLGLFAVLLINSKLLIPGTEAAASGTAWWVAVTMLAGFAADEFAQRIRVTGQAVFGKEK
jgi:hypothetical protein